MDLYILHNTFLGGIIATTLDIIGITAQVFKTKLEYLCVSSTLFCKLSAHFYPVYRFLHLMHKVYVYIINFV